MNELQVPVLECNELHQFGYNSESSVVVHALYRAKVLADTEEFCSMQHPLRVLKLVTKSAAISVESPFKNR
jgi:hypothetical protein